MDEIERDHRRRNDEHREASLRRLQNRIDEIRRHDPDEAALMTRRLHEALEMERCER